MHVHKVFFVGLGGAGQRHLRIFRSLLPNGEFFAYRRTSKTPLLNADFTVHSNSTLEKEYNLTTVAALEEGFALKPDLVVISTPTSAHMETALMAARRGVSLFVEKPLASDLEHFEELASLVEKNRLGLFVSYQRRFHPFIRKAKEILAAGKLGKIISADFHVASYVPHWHPYEDFRELYACRRELGGGALLTEIHELDLCHWFFGKPEAVSCVGGNYSQYKLDVEDTAHVTLQYNDFSVLVNLCFMQQHLRRDFHISGSKGFLEWNVHGNAFLWQDYESDNTELLSDEKYSNDDMFVNQARYFLSEFSRKDHSYLAAARDVLSIVLQAKNSMKRTA